MQEHWDTIYRSTPAEKTGWYEQEPAPGLRLVERSGVAPWEPILDVGSGASTFVEHLVDRGYRRIIASDISSVALRVLRERLGTRAASVELIVDDVTRPDRLRALRGIALWHDRAVLHFLLEDAARAAYVETLRTVLRPGGWVVLATFALDGATHCSGLPVRRYDASMLGQLLGEEFELCETFHHVYVNRRGEPRPYVYTLFRRPPAAPGAGSSGG
jgi:EEF1A lysine methyltransferase 2